MPLGRLMDGGRESSMTKIACAGHQSIEEWEARAPSTSASRIRAALITVLSRSGFLRCMKFGSLAAIELVVNRRSWVLAGDAYIGATATYAFPIRPQRVASY